MENNCTEHCALTDDGAFDGAKAQDAVILADTAVFRTADDTTQSRWRSPALWAAFIGLLGTVGFSTGLFERIGLTGELWTSVGAFLSALLAAFGIVNNPTDSENF